MLTAIDVHALNGTPAMEIEYSRLQDECSRLQCHFKLLRSLDMSQESVDKMQDDARKYRELIKDGIIEETTDGIMVFPPDARLVQEAPVDPDSFTREEAREAVACAVEGSIATKQVPTLGRIVLFTYPNPFNGHYTTPKGQGQTIPAIITAVWSDTCVNLTVFIDGNYGPQSETSVEMKFEDSPNMESRYWEWPHRN